MRQTEERDFKPLCYIKNMTRRRIMQQWHGIEEFALQFLEPTNGEFQH